MHQRKLDTERGNRGMKQKWKRPSHLFDEKIIGFLMAAKFFWSAHERRVNSKERGIRNKWNQRLQPLLRIPQALKKNRCPYMMTLAMRNTKLAVKKFQNRVILNEFSAKQIFRRRARWNLHKVCQIRSMVSCWLYGLWIWGLCLWFL